MPYINIKITREGVTAEQKAELIKGATELLARVLKKWTWTAGVSAETPQKLQEKKKNSAWRK